MQKDIMQQMRKGIFFVIGIAGFYTLFWLILCIINLYALKSAIAGFSNFFLHIIGVPSTLMFGAEPTIVVGNINAQITNLCAGNIEIALLPAIILATWDRPWRKRLWGVAFGLALIFVVNITRITTVLGIGFYAGWQTADVMHNLLFRISLIIIILLYYYVWYAGYDQISKKIVKIRKKIKL